MDQVYVVKHKVLVERRSVRRVARELGISRNTVRRYVEGAPPGVRKETPRSSPVKDRVRSRVEELLEDAKHWTGGKQRLTSVRLHEILLGEGQLVGERTAEVTRKKRAPKEYPVGVELADVLRQHRRHMVEKQVPGLAKGYMFPSNKGTIRAPSSLNKAWELCLAKAGIDKRFTVHGLRYTFTDLVRLANVDAVVRRALTGHVTEEMQRHYSTVGMDEKRAAVAGVLKLVPLSRPDRSVSGVAGGTSGGTKHSETSSAG